MSLKSMAYVKAVPVKVQWLASIGIILLRYLLESPLIWFYKMYFRPSQIEVDLVTIKLNKPGGRKGLVSVTCCDSPLCKRHWRLVVQLSQSPTKVKTYRWITIIPRRPRDNYPKSWSAVTSSIPGPEVVEERRRNWLECGIVILFNPC